MNRKHVVIIIILMFLMVSFSSYRSFAYHQPPLDTGHDQTNSQPPDPPTPPDPPDDDPCKDKNKPGTDSKGSPVRVATGDLVLSFVDATVPGPGLSMDVVRSYNSQEHYNGPFGYGWVSEHTMQAVEYTDGVDDFVLIRLTDGRRAKFIRNNDGSYTGLDVLAYDILQKNTDGSFVLNQNCALCARSSKPEIGFNVNGFPEYIADKQGNRLTFSYNQDGLLVQVKNTAGKVLQYGYNNQQKISQIILPNGNTLSYGYDESDNLVSVTDTGGNTQRYIYDSEHNLVGYIDANGKSIFQASYDDQDRVATYSEWAESYTFGYDPGNKKTTKTNAENQSWTYYYNDDDLITKVTFPDGSSTSFLFDENNNPTQVTDANGNIWTYAYDANGNLLSKTDPLGHTWTWTYNDANQKTSETDPLNATKTWSYDQSGNKLTVTDKEGNTWSYSYDMYGQRTSTTDPLGHTWVYTYNADGDLVKKTDPLGQVTMYTYDQLGRRLSETDPRGNTTYFVYNAAGYITQVRDALGHDTYYRYDASGNRISKIDALGQETKYVYDDFNRLVKIIDPAGHATSYTYNAKGQRTSVTDPLENTKRWEYNARGWLTSEIDATGNATTYTYDNVGNLKAKTNANGNVTQYSYDAANRQTKITDALDNEYIFVYDAVGNLMSKTDPLGYTVKKQYNAIGKVVALQDKNGNSTKSVYDTLGRLVSRSNQLGDTTIYTYDALNRRIQVTLPGGEARTFAYDAAGNKIKETFPNGEEVTYTYDALNRKIQASDSLGVLLKVGYDALGRRVFEEDGAGGRTQYIYDASGRQVATILPDGSTVKQEYDAAGQVVKMVDPTGAELSFAYDAAGRIVASTDAAGTTSVTYDAVGNKLSVTDAKGQTHLHSYDALGRLIQEIYPDESTRKIGYDALGNKISEVMPSGEQITMHYNRLGKMVQRVLPGNQVQTFSYDALGKMVSAVGADNATITLTYDSNGRLLQEDQSYGQVRYAYDVENGTRTITYPGGRVITEHYDLRGRFESIMESESDIIRFAFNNATGKVNSVRFANGIQGVFRYNQNGEMIERGYSKNGTWLWHYLYTLNNGGDIVDEINKLDSQQSKHFTYDKIERLTKVERGGESVVSSLSYDLDPLSNWSKVRDMQNATVLTTSVNSLNQYTDFNGTSLDYDQNGNLIHDGTYVYTYNVLHQLITVQDASTNATIAQYSYDPLGRRIRKVTGTATIGYVFDSSGNILEEYDNGSLSATYVYGPNSNQIVSARKGEQDIYYIRDVRSSPVVLTDASGNVIESYQYSVYGHVSIFGPDGTPRAQSSVDNRFFFNGHPLDQETGLYFFRARYYSSNLGRFLSRDPSGFVDSFNLYEYATSNPVNMIDPLGRDCQEVATVSWDAGQKIGALFNKTVVLRGLDFDVSGSISFKTERCKDRCCQHKTGNWVNLSWMQYTLEGKVEISYVGVIPGYGVDVGYAKLGLMGYIQVSLSGDGTLTKVMTQDCTLKPWGKACVAMQGSVGLRAGVDAGEQGSTLGVKAYLEGGLDPGGKLCYTNSGWDGQLCLGGHVKAVGEVRIIWYSAGSSVTIISGSWCIGNKNL